MFSGQCTIVSFSAFISKLDSVIKIGHLTGSTIGGYFLLLRVINWFPTTGHMPWGNIFGENWTGLWCY